MIYQLNLTNIKSAACIFAIRSTLNALDGVNETVITQCKSAVFVDGHSGIRDILSDALRGIGYREKKNGQYKNAFSSINNTLIN